ARGLTVLESRGLAHGGLNPLRPLLEMLRQRFAITDRDSAYRVREKIAGTLLLIDSALAEVLPVLFELLGVPDPERPAPRLDPEATNRLVVESLRRIVAADCRQHTVVNLIEDL